MKWPIRLHRSSRSVRAFRGSATLAAQVEVLEARVVLSAAFDVTMLTTLRSLPEFAGIDGALPDGTKIGIAIIDSGTFASHVDLQSNFVAFFDAVATDANADAGVTQATSESPAAAFDPDGHGTHVSGTAASSNPEIGVATGAGLIGIHGLPGPGETFPRHDTLLSGLQWVEENHERYNIKVVNMSIQNGTNLNSFPNPTDFARQIDVLEALGITVVSATGNAYADFAQLGASFPAVFSSLSVANTWEDSGIGDRLPALGAGPRPRFVSIDRAPVADQIAGSSQRSTLENQVAAPGSTILSTWNDGAYNTISGTSMASPFVTGLVALVQDAAFTYGGRYLSVEEVVAIVRGTADLITDSQNPNTQRAPLIEDANGNLSLGTIEDLLETDQTFRRVNALSAVFVTRDYVTLGTDPAPNPTDPTQRTQDTNNTLGSSISLPALDGTREVSISGVIGADGLVAVGPSDVDLFRIALESPGQLRLQTGPVPFGQNFDAFLRVFDANGTPIAFEDDEVPGVNRYPDLTTAPLNAGTYYFGISSFNNASYLVQDGGGAADGQSQGDYQVTVSLSNPDPNGVIQGAVEVDLTSPNVLNPNAGLVNQAVFVANRLALGSIGTDPNPLFDPAEPTQHTEPILVGATDVDFFRLVAPDSGRLFIDADTTAYGVDGVDPFVEVFTVDQNGNLVSLGFNDDEDPPNNWDSFLEVNVTIGQTYFVAMTTFGNSNFDPEDPFNRNSTTGDTGFYDLYLSFTNGDVNGTAFGAIDFAAFDGDGDGLANGQIGSDFGTPLLGANGGFKDVDFLFFTATQTGLLDVSVLAALDPQADPLDPVLALWELAPSGTSIMPFVDTTGEVPRAIIEVTAGQVLWISVTGNGNSGFNWAAPGSGTGGDTGAYRLSIQERDAAELSTLANNSITLHSPGALTLGQAVNETIGMDNQTMIGNADVDFFSYVPAFDQRVVIQTFTDQEDSADTFLRVFNAAGQELAFNNDVTADTRGSAVTVILEAGQTYFIGVNGQSANAGNYNPLTGENAADADRPGGYSLLIELAAPPIYAVGAEAGGGPHVRVFDAQSGSPLASFFPYLLTYTGGVRVATGDVNGDGVADIITAPGAGYPPHVLVFSGTDFSVLQSFFNDVATNGLQIASGDVNGDGFADIITAPEAGVPGHVLVYSGKNHEILASLLPYGLGFTNGIRVAVADVDADGRDDLIFGPGAGGPPHVVVYNGNGTVIRSFFAYDGAIPFGVYVAAGDLNGDGFADIVTGAGAGGGPHVMAFSGTDAGVLQSFFAYGAALRSGVHVGTVDQNADGRAEIVTAPGLGVPAHLRIFETGILRLDFINPATVVNAFPFGLFGGAFVAGGGASGLGGQALRLASAPAFTLAGSSATLSAVERLADAAISRWAEAGLSADQTAFLGTVQFSLGDLPGDRLGLSVPGAITLDLNAAGAGWYVDPTPELDEEFQPATLGDLTAIAPEAFAGVDLLSVIWHELSHQLGGFDVDAADHPGHLMADTLAPGRRRVPVIHSLDTIFSDPILFDELLDS